ncbi:MAG: TauD/TfdA family dioxygenase [Proteobacteria bacterium]|nr:TauD/TfdA family dioxygenase [Pseudomonadota bacterium]
MSFSHSNNELNIVGSDDTKSAYPLEFLTAWAYDSPSEQTDCVILWNKEIGDRILRHGYRDVCADPAARKSWLLSETDVSFHYESDDAILDNNEKIITRDASGRFRKIRINNRSMAPLRLDFDLVLPFYQASFKFRSILENEESQFHFQLQRGDLLLLDNERVLHGRIGHSVGACHLQGCYADRDGLRPFSRP